MVGTYTMRPSELTIDFIRSIPDETDYLLSSEANKNHLLKSIQEAEKHENLITVAEDTL